MNNNFMKMYLAAKFKHKVSYKTSKKKMKMSPSFSTKKKFYLFEKNFFLLNNFKFGQVGLFLSSLILITEKFILSSILLLKRIMRKRDKTLRKFWLTPFTPFYITYLSKGARMGKGKGKKLFKISYITPFLNFVEFKGISSGSALYYKHVISSSFPTKINMRFKKYLKHNNSYFK